MAKAKTAWVPWNPNDGQTNAAGANTGHFFNDLADNTTGTTVIPALGSGTLGSYKAWAGIS